MGGHPYRAGPCSPGCTAAQDEIQRWRLPPLPAMRGGDPLRRCVQAQLAESRVTATLRPKTAWQRAQSPAVLPHAMRWLRRRAARFGSG
eukprot:scaffold187681_cov29-Tisochrysis_lutea.AAC.4